MGGGGTPGFCIEHLEFPPYDSGEGRHPLPPPPPPIVQWYNGTSLAGSFDRVCKKNNVIHYTYPNPTERFFRAGGALRDFAVPILAPPLCLLMSHVIHVHLLLSLILFVSLKFTLPTKVVRLCEALGIGDFHNVLKFYAYSVNNFFFLTTAKLAGACPT